MSEVNKIYLLRGNDTPLSVCLRKREGDGDPVPYDLSAAERIRLALVGHGAHVFASGVTVSGEDNNIVSGVIPGRALLKGDYDLEVTFNLDGRDKRFAVEDMFEAVDFLAEDADGEAEGEGAGIYVTVTVQPEVIEIAGPTGPKGDTPVLTADEDGTIYADGVLLTEVVKDVTEAVESAEQSRAAAESQRVAAESARVSAETARESQSASDHTLAESDHTRAESDHTRAEEAAAAAEHMVDIKQGPQGPQGNTGSSIDYPYELVNNLTTDDATKGLSAAQGVVLDGKVSQLRSDVGDLVEVVTGEVKKNIVWTNGYVYNTGVIRSSSVSKFTQPILLKAGEKVVVGTINTNICIIGSTTADSLSVGGTITVIRTTSSIPQFETYEYTAQEDIKIVISVLASNYTLSFTFEDNLEAKIDTALDDAQTAIQKANNVDAAVFTEVAENLTDFISDITGSFIRASNHTIETNQYTGSYRLYLFRLSAGKYVFETTGESPASVDVVGVISSIEDFRVGGVLSESILVGSPATSVERTFNEETLVVLSGWYDRINYSGFVKRINKESNFNILEEQIEAIEEQISPSLKLTIPDVVYAVVGTEVNIWNDAVSLSIDKGLSSPVNYHIRWRCNKGMITDRCFRFTPGAGDVGDVSCTCFIYGMQGNLLDSKTFIIKVLSQNALQSAKNIAYFGDSLGAGAAIQLYSDFHDANKFGGVAPLMCGTRGTTPKYEAVGGYEWSDYATEGRTGYRASVEGVTSISLGAVYTDGVANFEVIEVNITDGSGNILLQSHYTHHGVLIMPSGTLTKVSGGGDDAVPYTNAFAESANPLWNDTTQELDVNQFKQMVGLQSTDKFDAVSFQFGVNEAARSNLDDILTYIDALYHCFVDDNPNCKFIIGLNTSSGNDVNGAGNNYGANFNCVAYLDNSYKIRQLYLTLQNNADYPNIRIAPIGLEVDRYYGYAFSTRQISQRYTENEQYHNNYVHPGTSGYGQMGDAYFAAYIGALTEL